MSSQHNLSVVLTGNATSLRSTLNTAGREVQGFTRTVENAGKTGASSGALLKQGLAAGIVAVGLAMAYSIGQAAKLDTQMRNIQSITKQSDAEIAGLSKTLVGMSTELPQAADTLAEGLYNIASSGFAGADGLKVLDASARAASAGLTTTEVSAKAITSVLNAYGMQASQAADVSDVLFQAVNVGVVTFEELSSTIGDVVGTAAAATVEIDEVASAIATMTLSGISAAEAGTSLNRLLQSMIDPSDELAAVFKTLGYESGAAALKQADLSVVMEQLRVASNGNIETLLKWFPEIRAARGALALMSAEGRNYAKVVQAIEIEENRAGATQAALNEQMKSLSAQWTLFKNRVNAAAITLGTALIPMLIGTLKKAAELGQAVLPHLQEAFRAAQPYFRNMADAFENVVEIVGEAIDALKPVAGLLGSIVVGGVIVYLNTFSAAMKAVTGFLKEHPGLIRAVALVLGSYYVGSLIVATAATAKLTAETLILRGMYAGEALANGLKLVASRAQMFATGLGEIWSVGGNASKGIGLVKNSLSGMGQAFASPTVAMGIMVLGLAGVAMAHQDAQRKARELRAELEKDIDYKSPKSIIEGVRNIRDEMDRLQQTVDEQVGGGKGFLNNVVGGLQLAASILPGVDAKMHDTNVAIRELDEAERANHQSASILAEKYAVVANRLGTTTAAVEKYVHANDLDPAKLSYDELEKAIRDVQIITEHGSATQVAMSEALGTVADEASNAKDEIAAFKDGIDALMGVQLNWFDAQTKANGALEDLAKSIKDTKANGLGVKDLFDSLTEGGRSNRDALSGMASAWIDAAGALADQGKMTEAVNLLKNAESSMRDVLDTAGLTKPQIDSLVESLGFVPGNYEALLGLTGEELAKEDLKTLLEGLDAMDGKEATATVNIIDASGQTRRTVDQWIQYYAMSDPTARVYVDDKAAKPSQEALEQWAEWYEDSDPTAQALMSILDPKGKYKNLKDLAENYEDWNPTTAAHLDTGPAQRSWAEFYRSIPKTVNVTLNGVAGTRPNFEYREGAHGRWGGIFHSYAGGGIHAHIARNQVVRYAEPETGGEAFVPRLGDPRRSGAVLSEAASWYGYGLVKMNRGGVLSGAQMSGTATIPPEVRVILEATGVDRALLEWLRKSIRVEGGGNVQVALGQGAS